MLKFIPVNINNIDHLELLKSISVSTNFLGDITKYRFHYTPNQIYNNDYIVCNGGELIGYLGITDKVETNKGNTVSIYYAIDSKYYGHGFGKEIIESIQNALRMSNDIDYIVATVDSTNNMGIKTIEKCGFSVIDYDDDEIEYISEKIR